MGSHNDGAQEGKGGSGVERTSEYTSQLRALPRERRHVKKKRIWEHRRSRGRYGQLLDSALLLLLLLLLLVLVARLACSDSRRCSRSQVIFELVPGREEWHREEIASSSLEESEIEALHRIKDMEYQQLFDLHEAL